jgi:osmotically-inducible protein OsmY
MTIEPPIVVQVRKELANEPRIDLAHHPLELSFLDGALTMEGEVASLAAKKLALERAAAVAGVDTIVDRLRVTPAKHMEDGEIRDSLRDALLEEGALGDCALRAIVDKQTVRLRDVAGARGGAIELEVHDGVVILNGEVRSLEHKRLAGVLAWWVPGSRDVVNGIAVEPPEEDSDAQVTDAVRMVLEKDPFVDAGQIRVFTRDATVTLEGLVRTAAEKRMAEADAWYVFGVGGVVNLVEVSERRA